MNNINELLEKYVEHEANETYVSYGINIDALNKRFYRAGATDIGKLLAVAMKALNEYKNLHDEYLEAGGLFNPELMQLRGERLRKLFDPANEAIAQITQSLTKHEKGE